MPTLDSLAASRLPGMHAICVLLLSLPGLPTDAAWTPPADPARLFDHFIGRWEFDCDIYSPDGGHKRFPGEWTFEWILDGRAIQDVWIGHIRGRGPGVRGMGTSLRFFDDEADRRKVVFVAPQSHRLLTLTGGRVADRIVLEGVDTEGALLRWSFNDVREHTFVWQGETSADGGATWRIEQVMRLTRRAGSRRRP
jgi:hypothetical protein